MQPLQLLHKKLMKKIPSVHKIRLKSVMASIDALIRSKKLTLTMLGRHIKNDKKVRSNIKKVDRLLANENLHKEAPLFYKHMNTLLMSEGASPWLHVDWSCLSSKNALYVLRASLSVRGRAITVYEEVHPKSKENNHGVHTLFLDNLKKILPKSVTPIIVTDAGFRAIWFDYITKMGWDFVGRVRNTNLVKLQEKDDWVKSKNLYKLASNTPKHRGNGLLTKRTQLNCEFILFKGKQKNRKKLNQNKSHCNSSKSKRYSKAYREPWLLVTSLKKMVSLAKKVVGIYRERMQIEETFRDTKDRRYGFGLNESGTKTPQRMAVLLLINVIATFVCWIAGVCVRHKGHAADYQAHSAKFTSALSIVYLGCEALRKSLRITENNFYLAIKSILAWSNTESEVMV